MEMIRCYNKEKNRVSEFPKVIVNARWSKITGFEPQAIDEISAPDLRVPEPVDLKPKRGRRKTTNNGN